MGMDFYKSEGYSIDVCRKISGARIGSFVEINMVITAKAVIIVFFILTANTLLVIIQVRSGHIQVVAINANFFIG
jgi:hypothetical protein